MGGKVLIAGLVVGVAVLAAACGGGDPGPFPDGAFALRANQDITVGTARLLVGVRQPDGAVLGSPADRVELEVRPRDGEATAVQRVTAEFTWIIPDVSGLYRGVFDFDRPGTWQATVIPSNGPSLEPALFSVLDPSCATADAADRGLPTCAVQRGEAAPTAVSPTFPDRPLEEISTDPDPDPRVYELSLGEALTNGRPTVVVFATPAFCQTAACGPLLDVVATVVDDHRDVDFVHVEIYTGFREPDFDPGDPARLAPAVTAYRLVSEPWVFVADAAGIVVDRFEGVMDAAELEAALANL